MDQAPRLTVEQAEQQVRAAERELRWSKARHLGLWLMLGWMTAAVAVQLAVRSDLLDLTITPEAQCFLNLVAAGSMAYALLCGVLARRNIRRTHRRLEELRLRLFPQELD